MQTRDHEELSRYLMEKFDYPVIKILRQAFILGSIEPDYNPITYLRGTIKKQRFRGHNFENAHDYIETLIDKIEAENISEIKRCYLLGKLIHYVADAFTFPHNKAFTGSLAEHCLYEKGLHGYMVNKLKNTLIVSVRIAPAKRLIEQIDEIHRQYLKERQSYVTDCRYILNAVTLVFDYFSRKYADCWNEQIA